MKSSVVEFETNKSIIAKSTWTKKLLADRHLEALLFCQYGCTYCSSNAGLHLRFKKKSIEKAVQKATGEAFDPHNAGHLVIAYSEIVKALDEELSRKRRKPGAGKTLVYSQLTDGFSPVLLTTGTARQILELLIEKTEYQIRVLTKNAIVGRPEWVQFFAKHADRFVVGLSIGTLDAAFAQKMEWLTSRPDSRIKALHDLQNAGVATFGMLCPVFPQILDTDELEHLIDEIRPELCEHVWAEPYNERHNWQHVRDCYEEGSAMWDWMTRVFEQGDKAVWSRYATDLYLRIHDKAVSQGWSDKLRYLLYEGDITAQDAREFSGMEGVLLQSKSDEDGRSRNKAFAAL
jgi:DNA repair photolyase